MLEAILSGARQPIACDDYVLVRAWDGQDTIELRLHRRDPAAQVLGERTRVYETTGGQTYYVSGVDGGQTYVDYVLKKDLSDWEQTAYPGYTNGSKDATAVSTITGVLPAGWTLVEQETDNLSAYLTLQGPTPLEVALQCMDTYGCALEFDNQKKVVYLHYPGKKTLGQAFLVETANLRQAPEYKSKAGSLVTRLYAQGADGIDFAAVNGGKNYVECFDYTDELVAGYWRDDSVHGAGASALRGPGEDQDPGPAGTELGPVGVRPPRRGPGGLAGAGAEPLRRGAAGGPQPGPDHGGPDHTAAALPLLSRPERDQYSESVRQSGQDRRGVPAESDPEEPVWGCGADGGSGEEGPGGHRGCGGECGEDRPGGPGGGKQRPVCGGQCPVCRRFGPKCGGQRPICRRFRPKCGGQRPEYRRFRPNCGGQCPKYRRFRPNCGG